MEALSTDASKQNAPVAPWCLLTRLGHPTLGLFMTEAHINPVLESTNSVTPCFCNGPSNPSAEATTLQ